MCHQRWPASICVSSTGSAISAYRPVAVSATSTSRVPRRSTSQITSRAGIGNAGRRTGNASSRPAPQAPTAAATANAPPKRTCSSAFSAVDLPGQASSTGVEANISATTPATCGAANARAHVGRVAGTAGSVMPPFSVDRTPRRSPDSPPMVRLTPSRSCCYLL